MKKLLFILYLCTCIGNSLFANSDIEERMQQYLFSPPLSSLPISNWDNPTPEDYEMIQTFLTKKVRNLVDTPIEKRPFNSTYLNEEFHGWVTYRMNRGCLIDSQHTKPSFRVDYLGNDPSNKKKCVICYASFPSGSPLRDYPRAINYLLNSLKKFKFDGHFIYQIGGWPNVKGGRLRYADVPFGFKPFLFEEVRNMGYQNILWLDACCVPVKSLDPIFSLIKKNGLCFYSYESQFNWREFCKGYLYLMPHLKLSPRRYYETISSQVVGINVQNKAANSLLNEWLAAAEKRIPFAMSDEPPFQFLVNHMRLVQAKMPSYFYVETPCGTGNFDYWKNNPRAILYHQYDFLDPNYTIPEDLLDH